MSDHLTSIAATMQSKKGIFALLLGSGISRSAQIPTGWEIVLDLIKRVATSQGETVDDDPADWYRTKFGKEPEYGDVLSLIATSSAERSQVIRPYIEPSEDERDLGLKQPTEAHNAIATLVADGYIRVIVTTNFDRLLEQALQEVGITPSVISSPDGINGTLPLAHNACTIIKIHGDYIDARIKNTPGELASYHGAINRLLRQVFEEYGLVISGWSADWDTALANLLQKHQSRWFSTYWVSYREPSAAAMAVVEARNASVITNMDADTFFGQMSEAVESISALTNSELLSVNIAEASLKRYIDDPTKRIRIHDLVVGEAARVRANVLSNPDIGLHLDVNRENVADRLKLYEESTAVLRTLFVTGCYWGGEADSRNWVSALERLASFEPIPGSYYEAWSKLRYYPAFLQIVSGGMAALAASQYRTLKALLYDPTTTDTEVTERVPLIIFAHHSVIHTDAARVFRPDLREGAVLPYHLRDHESLWSTLNKYVVGSDQFIDLMRRFEYLFGLVHTDVSNQIDYRAWGPVGTLAFNRYNRAKYIERFDQEIARERDQWAPLKAGMFGSSLTRLEEAKTEFDEIIQRRGSL